MWGEKSWHWLHPCPLERTGTKCFNTSSNPEQIRLIGSPARQIKQTLITWLPACRNTAQHHPQSASFCSTGGCVSRRQLGGGPWGDHHYNPPTHVNIYMPEENLVGLTVSYLKWEEVEKMQREHRETDALMTRDGVLTNSEEKMSAECCFLANVSSFANWCWTLKIGFRNHRSFWNEVISVIVNWQSEQLFSDMHAV